MNNYQIQRAEASWLREPDYSDSREEAIRLSEARAEAIEYLIDSSKDTSDLVHKAEAEGYTESEIISMIAKDNSAVCIAEELYDVIKEREKCIRIQTVMDFIESQFTLYKVIPGNQAILQVLEGFKTIIGNIK